ncbi:MAG: Maf family protein [Candidatus Heritagella sp.]|nr:Maf family protein [Candidatus Heritagella sp.]
MENSIILASSSPRRSELLTRAGVDFRVLTCETDESFPEKMAPQDVVKILAVRKNRAVQEKVPHAAILSADTVVAMHACILGKPRDQQEAAEMLTLLSGKTHSVYTGVCVFDGKNEHTFFEKTQVTFWPLTEKEIDSYIRTGEPMDKAGAYGIQGKGSLLVQKIHGDYDTVVGLPLSRTMRLLREVFPACLPQWVR